MNYFAFCVMAVATYITRASGFYVMQMSNRNKNLERWLTHVPGSVLIAMIAPHAVNHGHEELVGFIVTAIVQRATNKILIALFAGVVTVVTLRSLGFARN